MSRNDFQQNWNEISGMISYLKREKRHETKSLKKPSEIFYCDIDLANNENISPLHSEYQSYKEEMNQNFEL